MTGRTIVYLPNWLGDMVMAIPLLHSVRRQTDGELWFCGKTKAIHLYNGLDLFDRFFPIDKIGPLDMLRASSILRRIGFTTGIVLPHSFRAALLFFLAGVKRRIGYAKNFRGVILNGKLRAKREVEPTVEHYLKIADFLNLKRTCESPFLRVTEDEERRFFEINENLKVPYAVFSVGAKYGPSKCWPEEYFAKLADMIFEEYGMKVYILPDFDERKKAERIRDLSKKKDGIEIRYMGVRDLKVFISNACFLVSNDTGPRHIGSSLGVPTFVLIGPMDERYTEYPSDMTFKLKASVPCSPCNKRVCERGHECMKAIKPQMVFDKIKECLNLGRSQ